MGMYAWVSVHTHFKWVQKPSTNVFESTTRVLPLLIPTHLPTRITQIFSQNNCVKGGKKLKFQANLGSQEAAIE